MSVVLLVVLAWLWLAAIWAFAALPVVRRWTETTWWQPYGYFAFAVVEVLLAVALVAVDVWVGVRVWRRLARNRGT